MFLLAWLRWRSWLSEMFVGRYANPKPAEFVTDAETVMIEQVWAFWHASATK